MYRDPNYDRCSANYVNESMKLTDMILDSAFSVESDITDSTSTMKNFIYSEANVDLRNQLVRVIEVGEELDEAVKNYNPVQQTKESPSYFDITCMDPQTINNREVILSNLRRRMRKTFTMEQRVYGKVTPDVLVQLYHAISTSWMTYRIKREEIDSML